jgi:hypothetical protein
LLWEERVELTVSRAVQVFSIPEEPPRKMKGKVDFFDLFDLFGAFYDTVL